MNIKIGNTPLIKIRYKFNGKEKYIFTKLESYNLTGSIKDRTAYYIVKEAYKSGKLRKGMEIVEATSGNTGISLASIGNLFGNPVHIFMTDGVSKERISLMKMYNAKVTIIPIEQGGFKRALIEAVNYSKTNNAFFCNQFENKNNVLAHYETTGKEILEKLKWYIGGFVSGIGTGGTLMGVAQKLKEYNKNIKIYALEPEARPILTNNRAFDNHKIEGIGNDFIPKIVEKNIIDETILINDEDAINMSRKIALNLGIGVGISSGANMIASVLAKEENKSDIVTIFPDDNKKYLSTDLNKPIDNNEKYTSNKIELLNYEFI